MAPVPADPVSDPSLLLRALRALGSASSESSEQATPDLMEALSKAKENVKKEFPDAKPSGDGVPYLDRYMKIVTGRLRWRAWMANGKELVGLLRRVAVVVICAGFAWQHFVA